MDRVFQWLWDRYGTRYSWALFALMYPIALLTYLVWAMTIVAFEGSIRYGEAIAVTVVAVLIRTCLLILPGLAGLRAVEQWAAGSKVDPREVLTATYVYSRRTFARAIASDALWTAVLMVAVAAIAGATGWRLVQYGILGVALGAATIVVSMHGFMEGVFRPARAAIVSSTGIGDSLPRSRPTFAKWTNASVTAAVFSAYLAAAMIAPALDVAAHGPVLAVTIACALTFGLALPLGVGASFSPALKPIRDLAEGTERVAAGDYSRRLPGGARR